MRNCSSEPDICCSCWVFKKRFYLFIFRDEGREGEREGEKHQCVVASFSPPTGDLFHNPGMCLDWELNLHPFDLQSGAQSTELHQPGLSFSKIFLTELPLFFFLPLLLLSSLYEPPTPITNCTSLYKKA